MDLHKVSIDDKYWKDKVIENVFNYLFFIKNNIGYII